MTIPILKEVAGFISDLEILCDTLFEEVHFLMMLTLSPVTLWRCVSDINGLFFNCFSL